MIKQVPKELYNIHESDFHELIYDRRVCMGNWIPNSTFPQYSNEYHKDDIQSFIECDLLSEERGKEIFKTEKLTEEEYKLFLDKWIECVSEEPECDEHRSYYICPVKTTTDKLVVYAVIVVWGWGYWHEFDKLIEGVFYSIEDAMSHLEANGFVIN